MLIKGNVDCHSELLIIRRAIKQLSNKKKTETMTNEISPNKNSKLNRNQADCWKKLHRATTFKWEIKRVNAGGKEVEGPGNKKEMVNYPSQFALSC